MPLPKPTAIGTWPAIAVIGAAVATALKITPISPTAFGRGRWDGLGSRVLGDRAEVFAPVPYFRKAQAV
jgi:hypothetical protein